MGVVYIFNVAIIVCRVASIPRGECPPCTRIKIAIKYWERNLRILLTEEVKWWVVVV
jgi:hypothetical protein